jgi:tRNA(fMet)-specific endonuclease VapC
MFDTNAVSALVHHRRGFERLAGRVDALSIADRLISAVTMSEIETMVAKAANPQSKASKVRMVLAHFNILDFGEAAAVHAGHIRAFLEPRGLRIGPLDTLIAAHARSVLAKLVTDNLDEFLRVPDLAVESWLPQD